MASRSGGAIGHLLESTCIMTEERESGGRLTMPKQRTLEPFMESDPVSDMLSGSCGPSDIITEGISRKVVGSKKKNPIIADIVILKEPIARIRSFRIGFECHAGCAMFPSNIRDPGIPAGIEHDDFLETLQSLEACVQSVTVIGCHDDRDRDVLLRSLFGAG